MVRLGYCDVRAPFDGVVVKRHIEAFETVSTGKPLIDLVGRGLRVKFIVPSRWLRWLKAGTQFSVRIDEIGRTYKGEVKVINGRIIGAHSELLAGMSGREAFARLADTSEPATHLNRTN